MCRTDLFFLLHHLCQRIDIERPWLFERCREVQADPNGHLDLWARDHYKSTIITFGQTLQDVINYILEGRQITIGIFSHTRPIAKAFMRQLKREMEQNKLLPELFPEVFWDDPKSQAPKWSEDDGLILKRRDNPKEATIEAWGLVDGQPIGKHFTHLIYDDVVTMESVNTPDMIKKTTDAWAMSTNLGTQDGISRYIGTRYHFNDTYREIIARGAALPRIHTATTDGTPDGEPVLLTREQLQKKRRDQGPYIFASQMLQNPRADETQGFRREWLRWHTGGEFTHCNRYIIVDAASEKKKESDFTVMAVLALGPDENYYLADLVRDRLNLTQKADWLFRLHKKWKPISVGYEKNGFVSDIQHMRDRMGRENYNFNIHELKQSVPKPDRIRALIPLYEQGRFYLPQSRFMTTYDGRTIDLIDQFLSEEYDAFPVPVHDDVLDAMSSILHEDMPTSFPRVYEEKRERYRRYDEYGSSAWGA